MLDPHLVIEGPVSGLFGHLVGLNCCHVAKEAVAGAVKDANAQQVLVGSPHPAQPCGPQQGRLGPLN